MARCDAWYSDWPIRCALGIHHLGMHDTLDNSQFRHVEAFNDVERFLWPNVSDERFYEVRDHATLAMQRVELAGGTFNLSEIRNSANQFAPSIWTGYDAGTGDNQWYWMERRDNAAFWSAMMTRR